MIPFLGCSRLHILRVHHKPSLTYQSAHGCPFVITTVLRKHSLIVPVISVNRLADYDTLGTGGDCRAPEHSLQTTGALRGAH
jgi:hypothetical protein